METEREKERRGFPRLLAEINQDLLNGESRLSKLTAGKQSNFVHFVFSFPFTSAKPVGKKENWP